MRSVDEIRERVARLMIAAEQHHNTGGMYACELLHEAEQLCDVAQRYIEREDRWLQESLEMNPQ
jgi:hypothetical protein